jgi:hypothetical protein
MNSINKPSFENIKYGMLVEYHPNGVDKGDYIAGVKVHFFNRKGVLIGNVYEFVPYENLKFRESYKGENRDYQLFFMDKPFEYIKRTLFIKILDIVTILIRFTQKYID